jgi:hypothetical protein
MSHAERIVLALAAFALILQMVWSLKGEVPRTPPLPGPGVVKEQPDDAAYRIHRYDRRGRRVGG